MAEFQKVMKQWRRFCRSHKHCGECEFDGTGICGEAHLTDVRFADIELRIMAWAAEHPEPVYPTFREWLISIGVIDQMSTHSVIADKLAMIPIPADIAQKLGLAPKEG
jgi:hypothetical protein